MLGQVWPEVQAANSPSGLGVDRVRLDALNAVLHSLLGRSSSAVPGSDR